MTNKHTKEPWEVKSSSRPDDSQSDSWKRIQSVELSTKEEAYNTAYLARNSGQSVQEVVANANRIVAAVNFCEGFTNEQLEAVSLKEILEYIHQAIPEMVAASLDLKQVPSEALKTLNALIAKFEGPEALS